MQGLLVLYKPVGISSFKALSPIKSALPRKTKIGHTGTLDPFAEGIMIVLIGSFTRLSNQVLESTKTYIAEITLGHETDTLDHTGAIIKTGMVPRIGSDDIRRVLSTFIGTLTQVPPIFSAVHINGERAYSKARKGESFEIPSRQVEVHAMQLLSYKDKKIRFEVTCGSGTYIRSLARDIAQDLGTFGHLSYLQRSRVGCFSLDDAIHIENAFATSDYSVCEDQIRRAIRQEEESFSILTGQTAITISSKHIQDFADGKALQTYWFQDSVLQNTGTYGVFTDSHIFCGQIVKKSCQNLSYNFVSPYIIHEVLV